MKKALSLLLALTLALSLAAFGGTALADDLIPIVVGASATPHAEILEQIADSLAEEGYELQIVIYDDYVLPNIALEDGDLDANYFQHTPYLNSFNEANGTHLVSAALIHYEPFGIYANGEVDLKALPAGSTIIIPADDSNETRAILLLQQEGLVSVAEGATVETGITTLDIADDGGYDIRAVQADTVPSLLANSDEGTIAVINGNYALQAGLHSSDALALEDASGDAAQYYANLIAVKEGRENDEKTLALVNAIQTAEVASFIEETYNGAVVAVFPTDESAVAGEIAQADLVPTAIDKEAFDALLASGAVADDAIIAESSWASAVKKAGVLKVGGTRTSFLFSQLDETDNAIRGFDAGLYQLLARYILGDESKFDLTQVDSSTRESVLTSGTVDVVFATYSITPSRQEVISFAGPYYVSRQAVLVKAGNTEIGGIDELAGKTVATQAGSTGPQVLAEYAPDAIVQEFQDDISARTALEQGRVDAYVTDYTLLLNAIVKNPGSYEIAGEPFGSEDNYGIGLPKDSDGVAFVNAFLKDLVDNGTWAELWQITLGDRTGIQTAPAAPVIE